MHFSSYINNTHSFEYLSLEKEQDLAIKAQNGCQKSRQELIHSHLRLVFKIAKQFSYKDKTLFEDLVQEGNLGLIYAVDNFDHSKNCRLYSYAKMWVSEFIKRKTYKNLYMLSAPFRVIQKSFQVNKDPLLELDEEKKSGENYSIINVLRDPYSLDAPLLHESHTNLGDTIKDPHSNFVKAYEQAKSLEYLKDIMNNVLEPKEKVVIDKRFLKANKKISYKSIASTMNLSSETIRNIEKKALSKLRNYIGKI